MRLEVLLRGALVAVALVLSGFHCATAEERLAIKGYDPVAYFTDGKPTPGQPEHEIAWRDAKWRFASAQHRELFLKEPEKYAPQYGGYCAYGVAVGKKFEVDPEAWAIVDGRLYLNSSKGVHKDWLADKTAMIKAAEARWPEVEVKN